MQMSDLPAYLLLLLLHPFNSLFPGQPA